MLRGGGGGGGGGGISNLVGGGGEFSTKGPEVNTACCPVVFVVTLHGTGCN